MLELTKENIQAITETIDKAEITVSHLREDLIDHICCEIEEQMKKGTDFKKAFGTAKKSFGIKDLQQVQEQTLLLIDKNYCAMKKTMKVSGVISTSLLMFASLFKINHWPGANILLILGFFILCFLFLPSANYVMHRERKDKSMIFLFISAFSGTFTYFLGILCKIMHWPGANVMLLVGAILLTFLFLPLLLRFLLKNSKNKTEKRVYVFGVIVGMIYLSGFLFKIMHWPGAAILLTFSSSALAVVFIPWYSYVKFKNEKHIKGGFLYLVMAISWFLLFSTLISLSVSQSAVDGFIKNDDSLKRSISLIQKKNNKLIQSVQDNEKYRQIISLNDLISELCNDIDQLKIGIIKTLGEENLMAIEEGQINIRKLSDFSNTDEPSSVLFGDNNNGRALVLKAKIEHTKLKLLETTGNSEISNRQIAMLLDTSLPNNMPEWMKTWEEFYFYKASAIGCMNILSTIQRNALLAEYEGIKGILNQQDQ